MGISNLLPQLKSIAEETTLHKFKGKTIAVDGYVWLHRGVYSCSQELCLGQDSDRYVNYFMERVDFLLNCGIHPYIVFDGGPLPMKKATEDERRASREKHRTAGLEFLKNKNYDMARQSFVKAVDVSPYMAYRVIQRLKMKQVKYVVAPYEADAQMAYMVRSGLVDAVISEDSDCLPFGCKNVLFKMDHYGGVEAIDMANLAKNKSLSFVGFSEDMFLDMCILSGCDYVASIPGMGIKKSHALVLRYGNSQKVIRALRLEGKLKIAKSYETQVAQARLTFRHQRVYDPITKTLVHVIPLAPSMLDQEMDFLGPLIPNELAKDIAEGIIDPMSHAPFSSHAPKSPVMPPSNATSTVKASATPMKTPEPTSTFQTPEVEKENAFTRLLQAGSLMPRSSSKRKPPTVHHKGTTKRPALQPVPASLSVSRLVCIVFLYVVVCYVHILAILNSNRFFGKATVSSAQSKTDESYQPSKAFENLQQFKSKANDDLKLSKENNCLKLETDNDTLKQGASNQVMPQSRKEEKLQPSKINENLPQLEPIKSPVASKPTTDTFPLFQRFRFNA
ncbi:hypothetical protein LEN26_007237 [Aphanomyces euteiches]|nr:hypothetical protein AeMF1_012059 [Aphanomyces euteiches]KAH9132904.1 hypothetical protein LEN26_007237 [Aphanomyces euteiches]KAH9196617.1 hypothetical protein AeNC1_001430 [Aphanomyces euteiches]